MENKRRNRTGAFSTQLRNNGLIVGAVRQKVLPVVWSWVGPVSSFRLLRIVPHLKSLVSRFAHPHKPCLPSKSQLLAEGVADVGVGVGGPLPSGIWVHGDWSFVKSMSSIAISPVFDVPFTASNTN